jgi:hypothetical protein
MIARNTATGFTRSIRTSALGAYRLAGLPAGPYQLEVQAAGFGMLVRSGVTLHIGQEAAIDFRMRVTLPGEKLEVVGEPSVIETTKTSLGRTVTRRELDDLPINGRNFVNLAFLAPGILQAAPTQEGTTVSASGGNGANNTFLIDGVSADENGLSSSRGLGSYDGRMNSVTFRKLTATVFDPRQVQLGLRVDF